MAMPDSSSPLVDAALVRRLADLARIEVPEAQVEGLREQLARTLHLVSDVRSANVSGADQARHLTLGTGDLRADVPGPTLTRAEVNAIAPEHDGAFLVVPRFLGEDE